MLNFSSIRVFNSLFMYRFADIGITIDENRVFIQLFYEGFFSDMFIKRSSVEEAYNNSL